jgi:hypothetical protein
VIIKHATSIMQLSIGWCLLFSISNCIGNASIKDTAAAFCSLPRYELIGDEVVERRQPFKPLPASAYPPAVKFTDGSITSKFRNGISYLVSFLPLKGSYDPVDYPFRCPERCANWQAIDFWKSIIHHFTYARTYGDPIDIPNCIRGHSCGGTHFYFRDQDFDMVLQQWALYNYDGFWACIKQFPNYYHRIAYIHDLSHDDPAINPQLSNDARQRLCNEYVQANFLAQYGERNEYLADAHELQDIAMLYDFGNIERINKRIATIQEMEVNGARYTANVYHLNPYALPLIKQAHCNENRYQRCYGNQLQQLVHQECLDIINQINVLPSNSALYDYQYSLMGYADAACEYNQLGFTFKALTIADFCWALFDCGRVLIECGHSALEGTRDGIIGAVCDIADHPLETAVCLMAGEYVLAFHLSKLVYNVADLGITYLKDSEAGSAKWHEYTAPLDKLIEAIDKDQIKLRDIVKSGTRFVVQWKVQGKLLGCLGTFFKTAKDKVVAFIKNNPLWQPEQYLATPDGTVIKAGHELFHTMDGQKTGSKPKGPKHPPIPTEGPLWNFSPEEIEKGVRHVMTKQEKIIHTLRAAKHNLNPLIKIIGSEEGTVREIVKALSGKVHFNGKFTDVIVHVAGYDVFTRGRVMDGIALLGTFFIKD